MKDSALFHPVINPEQLRGAAAEAVSVLKILANQDRLLLLCQLSQGELCVSDLQAQLGTGQPTLSQQLAVLRNEGMVSTRREGKNIHCRIADASVLEMVAVLHRLYCSEGDIA